MNALFERDFVAYSASGRFQVLRFIVAGAMGVALLARVGQAYAFDDFSGVGASLLETAVLVGFALMVASVPGTFATVLVHARSGSTLPVLLATPLSPWSIASGAFFARAAAFAVLLVATLPPIASSLLFGGVRGAQVPAAAATLLATGLLVAIPAYVASAFSRRTTVAVVAGYLAAIVLLVALAVAAEMHGRGGFLAAAISPWHAAMNAWEPRSADFAGPIVLLLWTAAVALAAVRLVAWRLAREGHGTRAEERAERGRVCEPLRHENPVLARETGRSILRTATGRWLLGMLAVCEAAFVWLAASSGEWTSLPLHFGVLAMEAFLILLTVLAAGATALAAEREGRALDLFRVTPLTPREIVIGKLAGLFRSFAPCLAIPAAHLAAGTVLGVFSPWALPMTLVAGAIAASAWGLFALWQSLDQANPNAAVRRTMGGFAIVALLVAANLGIPIHGALGGSDEWVRRCASFAANPVAMTLLPAAALRCGGSDATRSQVPPPSDGDLLAAVLLGLGWAALHVGAGAFVYRRLFNTYRTRVDG